MKLLFENWRRYLKEEEEPDIVIEPGHGTSRPKREEDVYAEKVVDLFMASPAQAIHLGETMEIDPDLLRPMKSALEAFSNLVKVYARPGISEPDDELALMAYQRFESAIYEIMRHRNLPVGSMGRATKLVATARALARENARKTQRINHANPNDKLYNHAMAWLGDRRQ